MSFTFANMNYTQKEFVYDPNITVIPGSPDSSTTIIAADLLDGIEELIQGKIIKLKLKMLNLKY